MSSGYASQEPFSDEALRAAARAVRESMLRALEEEKPEEHSFSEAFLEKIRKLVAIDRQRLRRRAVWQRVAGIILGILIGSGFFLAFNAEARADFMSWVRSTYENSILYEFFQGTKKEEAVLPEIEFTWLPGEYEIQELYNNGQRATVLLNGKEQLLMLNYWLANDLDHVQVFASTFKHELIMIHDKEADIYYGSEEDPENSIVWENSDGTVFFNLTSELSTDTLVKIAEGIKEK